jgi:hypothetical protein
MLEYASSSIQRCCTPRRSGRDDVLAGTCNLEAWSLKRFFEIDVRVRSDQLAAQFDHRFSAPAEAVSVPGRAPTGAKRVIAKAFSTLAPVL